MAVATALGAAALMGGIGLTVSSAWLITMAAQHPPILVLGVSIVMVRFFGISRSAARYAERIVSHETVFRRLTSLRVNLYQKLAARVTQLAHDLNSGNFVKAIVDDVERAQEYQLRVVLPRYAAFVSIGFGIIVSLWIFPLTLIFILPGSLIFLLLIPKIISSRCSVISYEIEEAENQYAHQLSNATYGITEAVLFGYQDLVLGNIHNLEAKILELEKRLLRLILKLQALSVFVFGLVIVGSAELMYEQSRVSAIPSVKIAMAIFLPLVIFEGVTIWYPNLFISGKLLRAQISVDEFLAASDDQTPFSKLSPSAHDVELKDVRVAWNEPFMAAVSCTVGPGEILVIRGKSGSGKSTLAMGILGLLPYAGEMTIGGIEVRDISDIHHLISGSLQRGHIFNTSLRENLKIGKPDASDAELQRMCDLLELNAIDLDSVLGELGRPISGGEAKRVGVARALLSNAPIVLLDEPTEHLDAGLGARIEERIARECIGRTLIVITHSGWLKSDRTVDIARE